VGTGPANQRYYVHDHLYSPVALVYETGTVIERYEYDAYGSPTIWNADLTTERDSSNYGNPYLFTGRRVDILDSGSLKIQYNRTGSPNALFRVWGGKLILRLLLRKMAYARSAGNYTKCATAEQILCYWPIQRRDECLRICWFKSDAAGRSPRPLGHPDLDTQPYDTQPYEDDRQGTLSSST
jgi:hypothetical protein